MNNQKQKEIFGVIANMKFKFGFSVINKPAEEYFEYASEHNLAHFEIDLATEHSFIETFNTKRIGNLKKLSKRFKITLSLHTPYTINPSDKIPMIRDANIAYLKKCILVAHKLNATHVTMHIGNCNGLPDWTWMRQQALERLALNFKEVLKDCKKFKVKAALENVNPLPKNSEFFYLGDNIRDFEFLFAKLKSPYLNLCLDIGHANTNEGAIAYIQRFAKKIICVHYHDNKGKYDDHLNIGEGTVPWEKVVNAFKHIKFLGPFVSETFKQKPDEARDKLQKYI